MIAEAVKKAPTQEAREHSEGIVARTIEEQTAKLPSDIFLLLIAQRLSLMLIYLNAINIY